MLLNHAFSLHNKPQKPFTPKGLSNYGAQVNGCFSSEYAVSNVSIQETMPLFVSSYLEEVVSMN